MMKKICYLFLFLIFISSSYSQKKEILPEQPWVEIIQMDTFNKKNFSKQSLSKNVKMKTFEKVNIKLLGNYSDKDSIKVARAIRKLNLLTETIEIKFSSLKEANLKIHFLDSIRRSEKGTVQAGYTKFYPNGKIRDCNLYLYNSVFKKNLYTLQKPSVESRIARELVDGFFENKEGYENRYSIFSFGKVGKYFSPNLNLEDQEIIHEIYKNGFEEKLKLAKEQYKNKDLDEIRSSYNKVINRNKKLWWVRNPVAIVFIPTLLLFLFFLFITTKIKTYIDKKLKQKFLKFLLVSLIAVCFLDVLIIFFVSFFDHLKTPRIFGFSVVRFDTFFTTLIVSLVCFPLLFLFRFLELKIEKISTNILTKTSLIFLSTGMLPFLILLSIVFSIGIEKDVLNEVYHTLSIIFLTLMFIASLRALVSYFIFKERNLIVENENKLSLLRELKTRAELKSLQSQINPHFLYNSLNSIASLALVDASKTQQMAYSLSDLFKYSINRKGKKMGLIKDEIEMVESYLSIEKIRFGERLKYEIQVDETLMEEEIPLFLLQPLVENAVKHGISKNKESGEIALKIEKENNIIVITVADNGPHFPEGLVSGHGLQTVFDLLRLSYGDNAKLNWTNTPQKQIVISILK